MISFHRDTKHIGDERFYADDFEPATLTDLQRIARGILHWPWSPIQWWDGGRRLQAKFARALYCVLDFDDGDMTLAQSVRSFADVPHIIGTTRSHQVPKGDSPACDRFRVVVPFERPIEDLGTFKASMRYWVGRYGSDKQCVDGARFYWPCTAIISVQTEGDTLEVIDPPPVPPPRDYSIYREFKAIPRWAQGVLRFGCAIGQRNSTCFKLGVHLSQCGFTEAEIIGLIEASPIDLPRDEMVRAVRNGVRHGLEEMRRGQAQEE